MELKTALIGVFFISLLFFLALYMASQRLMRHERDEAPGNSDSNRSLRAFVRNLITAVLLRSYAVFNKIPPLRYYVLKVRSRLSLMHMYAEFELRRKTMLFVYTIFLVFGSGIAVLTVINPNIIFFLTLLITAAVLQGLFLDGLVNRIETKLLEQMLEFFASVRHAYHRHNMVIEAIEEAAEGLGEEIGSHAYRINEALLSPQQKVTLEQYYETAPNRYLKAFAGISSLVLDYGDKADMENKAGRAHKQGAADKKGSIYLRAISSLTQEIHLELIRRNKLDYLLKGLHVIALIPLFFTKPIEMWARQNFPLMDQFYLSKAGIIIKILIFVIILISYILLQKLKNDEETLYRAAPDLMPWEARFYKLTPVRIVVRWFVPPGSSFDYYRLTQLFKDTNLKMRVEWFQLRRLSLFMASSLLTLTLAVSLHIISQHRIMSELPEHAVFFGKATLSEENKARETLEIERMAMESLNMPAKVSYEAALNSAEKALLLKGKTMSPENIKLLANRIIDKLNRCNNEYLKWWEVILALAAGAVAYWVPLWMLWFHKKVRLMDMRHEIYQFMTMIGIFKELERISVEEILEWLYVYAVIFKAPIEECLLNYSQGAEAALEKMKEGVGLEEFQRLADKLLLAAGKITIAKAFDDLEDEMSFHFERRRLEYEKSLDTRAGLGRMIGFTPMYSLVFAYLVTPLIWMSFKQMDLYFEQIQKL